MATKEMHFTAKKLHVLVDKLNPDLRLTEEIDDKCRIREFYAMTPVDAFSILEAVAEINGYRHRLKSVRPQRLSSVRKHWRRRSTSSIRNDWPRSRSLSVALPSVSRSNPAVTGMIIQELCTKLLTTNISNAMVNDNSHRPGV